MARKIVITSGKGGVGKTWFSITLAHALSLHRQRTLLFDGDLGLANIDIQLGLIGADNQPAAVMGAFQHKLIGQAVKINIVKAIPHA